ncbi:MAG TPA: fatty acyl-AMP ligase, partial [Kofleriaceae bacterium]|nr:fatty acyl-AMP ligase [Kofleriaceae bacterium]
MRDDATWTSLVSLLEARAGSDAELGYGFLDDADDAAPTSRLTFAELDQRARRIAGLLRETCAPGQRALLLFPPGPDYVAAFFGCLYARVVAVPAYPPDPSRLARTLPRLSAIVSDASPAVALTTRTIVSLAAGLAALDPALAALRWMAVDDEAAATAAPWRDPQVDETTVAFLQYTSGSTGDPKGVVLSHGNLLHNQVLIQRAFGHDRSSRVVGWLPLYHDMGLIGNLLQPLYVGIPCTLMSPLAFLRAPLRWLRAITRFAATSSGGPNFAYELCARKATESDLRELDLSSWRVAFNGAEPVRADTMRRFADRFAPCGFSPRAFHPCYGLAESSLIVSGGRLDAEPLELTVDARALELGQLQAVAPGLGAHTLVASGQPLEARSVRIVEPSTRREVPDGQVGAIWVQSASVAAGYWGRDALSREVFGAQLASGEGPFLDTGDLGFVDGGCLFVTGRVKDLIIVRGRNLYPQDLERLAEAASDRLRPGCAAAFAERGELGEEIVLVAEVERGFIASEGEAVAAAVRRALSEQLEVTLHQLVLISAGALSKTSSGKVQRRATRQAWRAGELPVVWRSAPADAAG